MRISRRRPQEAQATIDSNPFSGVKKRLSSLYVRIFSSGNGKFVQALSWTLAAYVISRLALLIAGMELSRRVGVGAFAEFTIFVFSFNLLAAFSDLGSSVAMLKYGAASRFGEHRPDALRRLVASQQLSFLIALISFGALIAFTRIGDWPSWQLAALGLAGLGTGWQVTFASVLVALRELRHLFIGSLLFAVIVAAGSLLAGASRDWSPLMWALPSAYLAQCAWQAAIVQRHLQLPWREWIRPRGSELRKVLGLIGFLAPTSAIASTLPWLTANVQLTQGSDAIAVAVFGASITLFGLAMTVPSRIGQLVFVRQVESGLAGASSFHALRADAKAMAVTVLCAIAGVVVLVVFGGMILGRYGPDVAAQNGPIYSFISLAVVAGVLQLIGNRIVAAGWPSLWFGVVVAQALVLAATLLARPVGALWLPVAAYWAGYLAALPIAIGCYFYALSRARE